MATDGARALRAFETETIVARLRDLEFYDSNRHIAWWMVSTNVSLTPEAILALPQKPWNRWAISRNPRVSYADAERICAAIEKDCDVPCDFADRPEVQFADVADSANYVERRIFAQQNPNMTLDLYLAHPDDRAFADALENPAVANARVLRERPDFPWKNHARALARNPAFGDEALRELEALAPELFAPKSADDAGEKKRWNWYAYSWNEALSWKTVARHRDKPWHMYAIARNPKVVDFARWRAMPDGLGPGLAWNWCALSANPAVATWDRVRAHPELPWCKEELALNPAVCLWEAVAPDAPPLMRPNPADPRFWSKVQFVGAHEREAWARRWLAARRIQRAWCAAYYTPGTPVWRRRMARDVAELQGLGAGPAAAAAS